MIPSRRIRSSVSDNDKRFFKPRENFEIPVGGRVKGKHFFLYCGINPLFRFYSFMRKILKRRVEKEVGVRENGDEKIKKKI